MTIPEDSIQASRRKGTQNPRVLLAMILLTSVLLRVGVALYLGNSITETRAGTYDQVSYDALAQRVADGHGFSFASDHWPYAHADQPTAFWSYLYTLYLAGIYALFGHQPLIARLIQAMVVGLLTPWLTYRIASRIFNEQVGIMAAAIVAIYAYFIIYAGSLMTEALYIVSVLWCVDAGMRLAETTVSPVERFPASDGWPRIFLGLQLGIAFGAAILLRQTIVFFLPALVAWLLWIAWRRGRASTMAAPVFVSGLVALLMLLPFVYRNYQVFDRIAMPNTNAGFTFFWSNHPIYGTKFESVLSDAHGKSYQELIPTELREMNEAELDRALLVRGIRFVTEDPVRYIRLSLSRFPVYFLFWPTTDSSVISNFSRVLSFGLFLPFMIAGLVLAMKGLPMRWRESDVNPTFDHTILLLLFVVVYSGVHLASWANVRYRLPVDAFLIMFAGYAISRVYSRWLEPRVPSTII